MKTNKQTDLYTQIKGNFPRGSNCVIVKYSNGTCSKLMSNDIDVLKRFFDEAEVTFGTISYKRDGGLDWQTFKIIKG